MKSKWGLAFLFIIVMLIAGCGKNSAVTDNYTFGTSGVTFADQTLEMVLPFDLQAPHNDAEQAYAKAKQRLTRFGANAHFQTMVEVASKSDTVNASAWLDELKRTFAKPAFQGARIEIVQGQIAGDPSQIFSAVYPQKVGDKTISLTAKVYIWEHQDVVWKVFFQYPTEDADGAALLQYVENKVKFKENPRG